MLERKEKKTLAVLYEIKKIDEVIGIYRWLLMPQRAPTMFNLCGAVVVRTEIRNNERVAHLTT